MESIKDYTKSSSLFHTDHPHWGHFHPSALSHILSWDWKIHFLVTIWWVLSWKRAYYLPSSGTDLQMDCCLLGSLKEQSRMSPFLTVLVWVSFSSLVFIPFSSLNSKHSPGEYLVIQAIYIVYIVSSCLFSFILLFHTASEAVHNSFNAYFSPYSTIKYPAAYRSLVLEKYIKLQNNIFKKKKSQKKE